MSQSAFFIHAVNTENMDLMIGPFNANLTQDQVMDDVRTAFAGASTKAKRVLFNVGICKTDPDLKRAINWDSAEAKLVIQNEVNK